MFSISFRLWQFKDKPSEDAIAEHDRKRRFLNATLLVLLAISILYNLISLVLGYIRFDSSFYFITILSIFPIVALYLLNRRGHYHIAAIATVISLMALIYILALSEESINYVDTYLIYLFVCILLISVFFSLRGLAFFTLLNVLAVVALHEYYSPELEIELSNILYFLVISASITAIVIRHQNNIRFDHRQALTDLLKQQQLLLQTAFDGIVILNQQNQVLEISDGFAQTLGYENSAALLGKTLFKEPLPANASGGWHHLIERSVIHADGQVNDYELTHRREGAHCLVALRNITPRKSHERLLVQRADYLAALHQTTLALMHYQDQDYEAILGHILQYAASLVGTAHGCIELLHDEQMTMEVGIGVFASHIGTSVGINEGLAGVAYQSKQPTIIPSYHEWEHRIFQPEDDVILYGVLMVPLILRSRLQGFCALAYLEPDKAFTSEDIEILTQFADLAALVLHNTRLYQSTQQNQQMLNAIVKNTSDVIYIKDMQGRFLLFNPAGTHIFNIAAHDVVGKRDTAVILPDDNPDGKQIEHQVLESGVSQTYEFSIQHNDLQQYYLTTKFPYISGDNQIGGVVTISRNITAMKEAEQVLRQSEAYYRSLIENALDIILIVNRQGIIQFHSPSLYRILGYDEGSLDNSRSLDLVHPDDQRRVLRRFSDFPDERIVQPVECRARHKDGSWVVLELDALDRVDDPVVGGYIITARDISERKHAEQALQQHLAALKALYDASIYLTASETLWEVFEALIQATRQVFPQILSSAIHMINEDGSLLVPVHAFPKEKEHKTMISFAVGQGIAGRAFQSKKVIRVHDASTHPDFFHIPSLPLSFHSMLVVPLLSHGAAIGTLTITATDVGAFDENDGIIADMLARQTAVLLDRVQLFEEEKRQRRFSESLRELSFSLNSAMTLDELFEHILHHVTRTIQTEACNIMLLDDEHKAAYVVKHLGYDADVSDAISEGANFELDTYANLRRVMESKQPLVIADTQQDPDWVYVAPKQWFRSYACAPIVRNENVIGFLNLDSRIPKYFTSANAQQLMVFANQIGVAIEKVRLIESEQHQREISDTLRDIANILTQTTERDELLHLFLGQLARLVPLDAAGVWLMDEEGVSHCVASIGYERFSVDHLIGELTHGLDDPIMQEIIIHKRSMAVPDTQKVDGLAEGEFSWVRSWACSPIIVQGEFVGKLALDHTQVDTYDNSIIPMLETLVRQLSIAIENVELFEQVQQYAANLEKRVQIRTFELEQERLQLQAILTSMDEGVVLAEYLPDQTSPLIRYVNVSMARLLGMNLESVIARPWSTLQKMITTLDGDPVDVFTVALESTASYHLPWRGEVMLSRQKGGKIECAMTVMRVQSSQQQEQKKWLVTVVRDISREKALQAQRDRFVANASHELRTPLSNLVTRMYLLKNQPDNPTHIEVMERTINRLTSLAQDLLDVTRYNNGVIQIHPKPFDLREIAADVIELQEASAALKSIALVSDFPDEAVWVTVDENRFHQVIMNLVVNAISYTTEGTTVTLRIVLEQEEVVFSVEDEGIGLEPEQVSHVFDPFYRASEGKVSGTGLGLTISREIVHLHGGNIEAQSTLGKGTQFIIRLARNDPEATPL